MGLLSNLIPLPDPLEVVSNPVAALLDPINTLTGSPPPPPAAADDIE